MKKTTTSIYRQYSNGQSFIRLNMTLSANNGCACLRLCLCTSFGAHIFLLLLLLLPPHCCRRRRRSRRCCCCCCRRRSPLLPLPFSPYRVLHYKTVRRFNIHVQRLNFSIVIEAKFVFVASKNVKAAFAIHIIILVVLSVVRCFFPYSLLLFVSSFRL